MMIIGGKSMQYTPDRVVKKSISTNGMSNSSYITSKIEEAVSDLVNNMLEKMKYGKKPNFQIAEQFEKELENCDTFLQIFGLITELFDTLIEIYSKEKVIEKKNSSVQVNSEDQVPKLYPKLLMNYEKEIKMFKLTQKTQDEVIEKLEKKLEESSKENQNLLGKINDLESSIEKMKQMNQIAFLKKPPSPGKHKKNYKSSRDFFTPKNPGRNMLTNLDFSKITKKSSFISKKCFSSQRKFHGTYETIEKSLATKSKKNASSKKNGRNYSYSGKIKKSSKERTPNKNIQLLLESKSFSKTKRKKSFGSNLKNKPVFLTHNLSSIKTPKLKQFRQRRALSNSLFQDYVKIKSVTNGGKKDKGKKKKKKRKRNSSQHYFPKEVKNGGNKYFGVKNSLGSVLSPGVKSFRRETSPAMHLGAYLRRKGHV